MLELEKSVQAINYLIKKLNKSHIDKLEVLKLIFLADRYHLRKYARTITNDTYFAMTYGPVASSVKDIAELSDFLSETQKKYTLKYLDKAYEHQVKSIAEVDLDVFSKTDLEALDKAVELKNKCKSLVDFTHEFPEWKNHEGQISELRARVDMDLIDCFLEAPPNIEYCPVDSEILELNKEHYESMKSLW